MSWRGSSVNEVLAMLVEGPESGSPRIHIKENSDMAVHSYNLCAGEVSQVSSGLGAL